MSYLPRTVDKEIDKLMEIMGAVEIKLGADYIDEASNNLLKFKDHVDTKKCGEPT